MSHTQSRSVLVVVTSAGIDPWLEIEQSGQERILCADNNKVKDYVWISANPNFVYTSMHRLLIGVAKLQMWHFPGAGKYFVVLRRMFVELLKCFPIQLAMRSAFRNSRGKPLGVRLGNRVVLDLPASTFVTGHRTIRIFEWALNNSDFDYLVRITSTCLINEPALMRFVEDLPDNRVYAGQEMSSFGSNLFMSGSAIVLSRDVVIGIVENKHRYRFDIYEDVALGRLISEYDIARFVPMDRLDLQSISSAKLIPLEELASAPVIRCKAEFVTESSEPVMRIFDVVANRLGWDHLSA